MLIRVIRLLSGLDWFGLKAEHVLLHCIASFAVSFVCFLVLRHRRPSRLLCHNYFGVKALLPLLLTFNTYVHVRSLNSTVVYGTLLII